MAWRGVLATAVGIFTDGLASILGVAETALESSRSLRSKRRHLRRTLLLADDRDRAAQIVPGSASDRLLGAFPDGIVAAMPRSARSRHRSV